MLKMGCAQRDVTPDFPVMLHGYGARWHEHTAVEDPVELGVIIVEQEQKKVLLIMADMISICSDCCEKIKAAVRKKFGFAEDEIWISCSHTHFAPAFQNYPVVCGDNLPYGIRINDGRFYSLWMKRLFDAVAEAEKGLAEVTLECVDISVPEIAFNRRTIRKDNGNVETNYTYPPNADEYHFLPIDDRLSVWRFSKAGVPAAILARYGCHPVTGGKDDYGISADYPGAFRRAVQKCFGCPGFFMLGTAGDVVPVRRNGNSREDLGELLARTIRLNDWVFRKADSFTLKTGLFTVKSHVTRLDEYDRSLREELLQKALKEAKPSPNYNEKLAEATFLYEISGRYPESNDWDIPILLLRLGSKVLVGLPFEVFAEIGFRLTAACPEALLISVTNGDTDYLPLRKDFERGGYEVDIGADFAPETGDNILAAVIERVKAFK